MLVVIRVGGWVRLHIDLPCTMCNAHGKTPSLEVLNPTELFTECSWWQRTQNGALATTSSAGKFLHFRNIFLRETKTGRGRERGRRRWNEQRREEKQKLDVGALLHKSVFICPSSIFRCCFTALNVHRGNWKAGKRMRKERHFRWERRLDVDPLVSCRPLSGALMSM